MSENRVWVVVGRLRALQLRQRLKPRDKELLAKAIEELEQLATELEGIRSVRRRRAQVAAAIARLAWCPLLVHHCNGQG